MKWPNKIFRLALFLPFLWWAYLILFGSLGAEPAKELNHLTGFTGLLYLFSNLAIGIFSSLFKFPARLRFLLQERRWLGVIGWFIIVCHVSFYFVLEALDPKAIQQIFEKTYLTFGFFAFLGLTMLAATSNNYTVRKLGGKRWKLFHRSVYFTALLVTVHIFLIEKANLLLFALITAPVWTGELLRLAKWIKASR